MTILTAGEYASFQNPAWSPDGRFLAYDFMDPATGVTRDGLPASAEIYVLDLESGNRRRLTDNNVADVDPHWSPNGQELVFVRAAEDSGYPPRILLMLITVDGGSERLLLECPSPCLGPKWSPDGELVTLSMEDRIWTIRRDSSDLQKVSGQKATAATYPAWSPDGRRLVYWATLEANSVAQASRGDLAVLDLGTGEETIVLSGLAPLDPDWSPLGASILYSDQPAPEKWRTLFTLDLETGATQRLIAYDLEYSLFDAVWSPDGRRIAFAYGSDITRSHLYILDLGQLGIRPDPSPSP